MKSELNDMSDKLKNKSDRLTEGLAKSLFSGQTRPNELLPTEAELGQRYDVSRPTIRNRLEEFANYGIIRRQPGQGTRVLPYSEWNILSEQVTSWISQYAEDDLPFFHETLKFRSLIEPIVSAEAAIKAQADDLMHIERGIIGMEKAVEDPDFCFEGQHYNEWDASFHEAIYRASRSMMWGHLAAVVRPTLLRIAETSLDKQQLIEKSLPAHRQVFEAIRRQQPRRAYDLAREILVLGAAESNWKDQFDDAEAVIGSVFGFHLKNNDEDQE